MKIRKWALAIRITSAALLLAVVSTTMCGADLVPDGARSADSPTSPALGKDPGEVAQRVDSLLAELTIAEKVQLTAGGSTFGTSPIPRLGIPALRFADGPNGVRSNDDQPATVFPTGVGLAATWNPPLVQRVGEAIGREARAMGIQVLLGPNVNIQRTPLAGRNFEAYSEDPYLAGKTGTGFVLGVQSQGVGTSPKHFVGNEQELERMRSNSVIDERSLHEIYLAPFEAIVRDAKPWTLMASYNRVNGTYMTENSLLLNGVLKSQWGFDGVLMSDWGAVHTTAPAALGGTDLEMPGPARYFGAALGDALRLWQVPPQVVDEAARRMLRLIVRSEVLQQQKAPGQAVSTAQDQSAAHDAAGEAIALLKNEGALLPLSPDKVRSIAVIGPNADVVLQQGGGSANVIPSRQETPLTHIRRLAGSAIRVYYEPGVDNDRIPPPADYRLLSADRSGHVAGLKASYYVGDHIGGPPVYTATETYFDKTMFASRLVQMAGRWEGWLWPQRDGVHEFRLATRGEGTLSIDGQVIINRDHGAPLPNESDFQESGKVASLKLIRGHGYRIRIDYVSAPIAFHQMHFGIRQPPPQIDAAVRAAAMADIALVFIGVSRTSESEGRDRPSMDLVGAQDALVDAVLKANPRTVVVLNNGAPVALPWASRVPAILEAWLPGQEGASALAEILFGVINPSGHLPFTFPRRIEDTPTFLYYGAERDAIYGEGVFVGYRYYDKRDLEPLFPFGHGLSYTQFEYQNLSAPPQAGPGPFEVSVQLRNTGNRAGAEVVQLYISDAATRAVIRPPKELRGFVKVRLEPGEARTVRFTITARDLAYFDTGVHDWQSTSGPHELLVGASSRDIRLRRTLQWQAP